MLYYHTDEAIRLIMENDELAEFAGGVSTTEEIARAEERLGVEFPPSYRRFLEQLGAGRFGAQVFFGLSEAAGHSEWDVVHHTLDRREHSNLGGTTVVVGPYGEEAFFILDCARPGDDDECPVAEVPAGYSDIEEPNYFEDNFGRFIYARVCDVLGKPGDFSHP
ncbi:MAG: SMI1/KNR4 family protein [Persicimonas sp.]